MLRIIVIIGMMFSFSMAKLSDSQIDRIANVYKIGKTVTAKDGMTFEQALSSIYLQESSAGVRVIGDKYTDKYYYMHHNEKVMINKKKLIKINGRLWYMYNGIFKKKIYTLTGQLKPLGKSSLGGFQIKLSTAKYIIKKNKMKQYYNLLKHDTILINRLLVDYKFSARIALQYLIMNYHEASDRKMLNPYFKTISRYNGGWYNKVYYGKVMDRMKTIKKLISLGKIGKK